MQRVEEEPGQQEPRSCADHIAYVIDLVSGATVFASGTPLEFLGHPVREPAPVDFLAALEQLQEPDAPPPLARLRTTWRTPGATAPTDREQVQRLRTGTGAWRPVRMHEVVFARDPDGQPRQILGMLIVTDEPVPGSQEREHRGLLLLAETAPELLVGRNAQHKSQALFRRLGEHLGCELFFHYLLEQDELALEECGGVSDDVARAVARLKPGELLCGQCAQERRLLYLPEPDLARHPRAAAARGLGLRLYVGVPLLVGEQLLGTLAFASRTRSALEVADLDLLRTFGNCVAAATLRRRTEQELRENEARFRTFVDHATDALFLHANDGRILDVNRQACRSLGRTREELIGQTVFLIDPAVTRSSLEQMVARLDNGETLAFDSVHRHRDGHEFPVEVRIRPFWSNGERFAIALARDISQRQSGEAALRRANETLRRTQRIARVSDWSYDVATDALIGSQEAASFTGWDGRPHTIAALHALVHADDRERVQQAWQATLAGSPYEIEHRMVVNGKTYWVRVWGEPEQDGAGRVVRINGVTQDITASRDLELQLLQAQKMEAIGRLAGGIAHDFNNLLTVISGCSESLLERLSDLDPARTEAIAVRDAGLRAASLTRQLLAFGRRQFLAPVVLDLGQVLRDMEDLLRRLIKEDIALTVHIAPDLPNARVDRGQFEQVILNLVLNARDAVTPGHGRIAVTLRGVAVEARDLADAPGLAAGPYVEMQVQDNGHGMSPEVCSRVFEPFFTTKDQGTGLGLATVYGIIKQSGGHIRVASQVQAGTMLQILLPACPAPATRPDQPTQVPGGHETVLLVEDEAPVRRVLRAALAGHGFSVLEAEHGPAALALAARTSDHIDLLVTDVLMPGIGGRELADTLRLARPDLRVLFISGYTDDTVLLDGTAETTDQFLQKPFTASELLRKVRGLLDAPATRPA